MPSRSEAVSALVRYISAAAEGLAEDRALASSEALQELAVQLAPLSRLPLDTLIASLKEFSPTSTKHTQEGPRIGAAINGLNCFTKAKIIASPRALRTLERFRSSLAGDLSAMSIRDFADAIKERVDIPRVSPGESVVDAYVRELTSNLHNAGRFKELFDRLRNDNRLRAADVATIASAVAFSMSKSTPKKLALERIWKMHDASESFSAKAGQTPR